MQNELKSENPIISILMIVRNEEKFLDFALKSILASSFSSFELIVINDASKDSTFKILEHFSSIDRRLRVFKNNKQIGLAGSLNKAFKLSKGKFIARMDGDDICHVERLMSQYQFLIRNSFVDIIGCNAKLIDIEGNILGYTNVKLNHSDIIKQLNHRCPMIHPSILMRREVFESVGGYDTRLKRAQDFDFWINAKNLGYVFANLQGSFLQYRAPVKPNINVTFLTFLSHMTISKKQGNFLLFLYSFFELLVFLLKYLNFIR
ncbi:glycosyltransferase, partial [Alphaproteobacteria bacterium]|nr:glycosyltransferase [Alphaproteobacteria bacterium]